MFGEYEDDEGFDGYADDPTVCAYCGSRGLLTWCPNRQIAVCRECCGDEADCAACGAEDLSAEEREAEDRRMNELMLEAAPLVIGVLLALVLIVLGALLGL
jgi:hypothetical protein